MEPYLKISIQNGQPTLEGPKDVPTLMMLLAAGQQIVAQIVADQMKAQGGKPPQMRRVLLPDGSRQHPGLN